jgi:hypothetical protein
MTYQPATEHSNSIKRPVCSRCGTATRLFGIEPSGAGFEMHSFECPKCHHIEIYAMTDLKQAEQELKNVRQEVRNLTVMGMRPNLLPAEVELVKNLERSARAEAKLRRRYVAWLKQKKNH